MLNMMRDFLVNHELIILSKMENICRLKVNLHHSNQNRQSSLFELSHETHRRYYGSNALHPHLPNQHPTNPVDRDLFNGDRKEYWRKRARTELLKRDCGD